jgi:hypothetical protein
MTRGAQKRSRSERRAIQRERDDAKQYIEALACPSTVARALLATIEDHVGDASDLVDEAAPAARVWGADGTQPALAVAIQALVDETRRHLEALEQVSEQLFAVTRDEDHEDLTWDEVIARLRSTIATYAAGT